MQDLSPPAGFAQTPSGLLVPTQLAVTIGRTPIIDDDGSGETGTSLDNAWKQEFYGQIDAALAALQTSVTTGAIEQIAVSAFGAVALNENCSTHILFVSVTGGAGQVSWTKTNRKTGDRVIVLNRSTGIVQIPNNNVTGGFIVNIAVTAPTPLAQYGVAVYTCSSAGYWILTTHEQGAWITAPFSAANFVGTSGMTWTVTAGNVGRCAYKLTGRDIVVSVSIGPTTLGGTASQFMQILNGAYGGFTSATTGGDSTPTAYLTDGTSALTTGLLQGTTDRFNVQKTTGVFALGASCYCYGQARFEVN